jgi:hypothetical protein
MPALTVREFLGHSARGSKRNFLKSWKDKHPFSITTWLHTRAPIISVYRHRFVRVVRRNVEGKPTVEIWSDNLVCWESEELLQKQNYYDRDTGEREEPPVICGHCRLTDWLRNEIRAERLDWREPVFRFVCDDPSKTVVLHAGGMCHGSKRDGSGMFGDKKLTAERKKMMIEIPRDRGGPVYQKNAFKEDSSAKLEYVMAIVDNDEPGKGCQIAIEGSLLGQKVQDVITTAMKSLGGDEGDPSLHPYAIQWEHDPSDGIEFGKKYNALRMERIRLTAAIKKLIVDDPPPDLQAVCEKFDPNTHKANLERQALIKMPFDEFFAPSIAAWKAMKAAPPTSAPAARTPNVGTAPAVEGSEDEIERDAEGFELLECVCGKPMRAVDPVCPHCGKQYAVVGAAPAAAPRRDPLPLPPAAPGRAAAPAGYPQAPPPDAGDGDDDIPFAYNSVLGTVVHDVECELWLFRRLVARVW